MSSEQRTPVSPVGMHAYRTQDLATYVGWCGYLRCDSRDLRPTVVGTTLIHNRSEFVFAGHQRTLSKTKNTGQVLGSILSWPCLVRRWAQELEGRHPGIVHVQSGRLCLVHQIAEVHRPTGYLRLSESLAARAKESFSQRQRSFDTKYMVVSM